MSTHRNLSEVENILTDILRKQSPILCDWTVILKTSAPAGLDHYMSTPQILLQSKEITIPGKWDLNKIIKKLPTLAKEAISTLINEAIMHDRYLNSLEARLITTLNSMKRERPEALRDILADFKI